VTRCFVKLKVKTEKEWNFEQKSTITNQTIHQTIHDKKTFVAHVGWCGE
jgi:hypothetical protein